MLTSRLSRAALTLAVVTLTLGLAGPAAAHDGGSGASASKRQQYTDGVSVPVISTPNIRHVTNVPDTAGISGVFAHSAPYFYLSSTDSITVYDVSNPVRPRITGVLPNVVFENEAMNYGEKKRASDGTIERFVLVGVDLVEASPTVPDHIGTSNEVMVVDVTDPTHPVHPLPGRDPDQHPHRDLHPRRPTAATPTRPAATGSSRSSTSPNLDAPREVGVFDSPAGGPNPAFTSGAGHKWNFDDAGYGTHTGSGGSAVFDVSDPGHPRLVATTDAHGVQGPWNDFIHHNSVPPQRLRSSGPGRRRACRRATSCW